MTKIELSKLEEDFIGDVSHGPHELWELYGFVRLHYADASDDETLQRGYELLSAWVKRGWLKAVKSRSDASFLSGEELLAEVTRLGATASDPEKGTILLDITDRAMDDVPWLRSPATLHTTCCIAGGGPAGMMMGLLLARAGIDVIVLEKHADFLRDFRGDTIHPSTLEVMKELGLLEAFLKLPHQKARQLHGYVNGLPLTIADFSCLRVTCPYIAMIPQWDFLNFIASEAAKYPTFHLKMKAQATGLIEENGRVTGIEAMTPEGPVKIYAPLCIGADGRRSTLREKSGLEVKAAGVPIDVLWMKLSHQPGDQDESTGYFDRGRMLATIHRGDYWQCAYVIAKGGYDSIREQGLERFRTSVAEVAPMMSNRLGELASWDDIKLLNVSVDHMPSWYKPGLLFIGDAAHAMSPVGGVGINLAIQDAVAAARLLAPALRKGAVTEKDLERVQCRRELPARLIQYLQIFMHARIFGSAGLAPTGPRKPALLPRLLAKIPLFRCIPAHLVGMGFRPEHVQDG